MQELVSFIVKGIVSEPESVSVNEIDGETSVLLEIDVAEDDRLILLENESQILKNIRAVANAASGRRQAVVELLGAEDVADVGASEEE
tara:strand:- start:336 stop:599 length:264 start_codon:yes stop_codon:yes gene_type:complete